MKRLYFDYAASTPVDPLVMRVMKPYFIKRFGNPGSLHLFGQEAITAVDNARNILQKAFGAVKAEQVIFTSSATEANNMVLRGAVQEFKIQNSKFKIKDGIPHIITSVIEHESVLETLRDLEKGGYARVTYVSVSPDGFVDPEDVHKNICQETILVSIMYANNEIGTIQPIAEIAKVIRDWNSKFKIQNSKLRSYPLFHTDAAQAFQFLDCNVEKLGVDFLTVSSQKIYGPKGAAALYIRDSSFLRPIITGGDQEYGFRAGTPNVPAIVGFGKAVSLIEKNKKSEAKRLQSLRDYLWRRVLKFAKGVELNGSLEKRLPNNLNIYFHGKNAEDLLLLLDRGGVAVSAGSACSSRSLKPSYALTALGKTPRQALASIRISFGRPTTLSEVKLFVKILKRIINS